MQTDWRCFYGLGLNNIILSVDTSSLALLSEFMSKTQKRNQMKWTISV